MSVLTLLVRRVIAAVLLVFLVTSAALFLARVAPGDYSGQFGRSASEIAAERHRLGLDRPMLQEYAAWLRRAATFDFGESYEYQRPVLALVREHAANTALLAVAALIVATAIGLPCGLLTGSRRRGVVPSLVRGLSLTLLSVPPLVSSLILVTIAARTGWFPVAGMDSARSFVVPTLALALPLAAVLERLQAQAILEALQQPFTQAARARGLSTFRIVTRHAWRPSLGSVLAVYGVVAGSLFSGSFAVEIVSSWPGLGVLMLHALQSRDTYLVAGCTAAGAVFLAIAILVSDVLHLLADPRTGAAA